MNIRNIVVDSMNKSMEQKLREDAEGLLRQLKQKPSYELPNPLCQKEKVFATMTETKTIIKASRPIAKAKQNSRELKFVEI
jgi:hypothetical protein